MEMVEEITSHIAQLSMPEDQIPESKMKHVGI
jgi:hypothetical protein